MRNRISLAAAVLVTAFLIAAVPGQATGKFNNLRIVGTLGGAQTAVNTVPAIFIKYTNYTLDSTPTVEVDAATGDIEFVVDGVADVLVSCPEGDDDGVIDVSDAACNTWIEVVDAINQGGSFWAAALGAVLGTDDPGDVLLVYSASGDDLSKGVGLLFEDDVDGAGPGVIISSLGLYPPGVGATTATSFGNAGAFFFNRLGPNKNPFAGYTSIFTYFSANQTSGGTIALTNIFGVFREYRGNPTNGYDLFERIRTVWAEAGAATTVENTTDFSNFPLVSAPGEIFLFETNSSTDLSAITNVIAGVLTERTR